MSATESLHGINDRSPNTSIVSTSTQGDNEMNIPSIHDSIAQATCFLDKSQEEEQEDDIEQASSTATPNHKTQIIDTAREDIEPTSTTSDEEVKVSWEEMTVEELKDECRKRNIKNVRKNSKHATLVHYLLQCKEMSE